MGEQSPENDLPSRIARLVHTHFDTLPARSKPIVRDDGTREWIPMAGMVVVRGENTPEEELTCVAVTSGAKCLAASQLAGCKGLVLHDWHAEILALRAFNYWVLNEVRGVLEGERRVASVATDIDTGSRSSASASPSSRFIRRRHPSTKNNPPFELHPDLKVYMCCTCAPCGDASMELTMAAQEDPTPWEETTPADAGMASATATATATATQADPDPSPTLLDGRGHFSKLGIVRRKPARADADSTKSKSCSDKLALRQVSSLLNHETALLVDVTASAYLAGVVLPETEISEVGCQRAFGRDGRMKGLVGSSSGLVGGDGREGEDSTGYRFHPFKILSIPSALADSLWKYGKPRQPPASSSSTAKYKPGTISALWVVAPSVGADQVVSGIASGVKQLPKLAGSRTGLYESIIGGVKQGSKASAPVVRGASALSRVRMWGALRDVILSDEHNKTGSLVDERLRQVVSVPTYAEFKQAIATSTDSGRAREQALQAAKTVLVPWVPNSGDEDWGLEVLIDTNPKKRKR
ncbi:tRNA-specific adenosine deaminase [Aspergillus homomorphus CBS 101889]|uniref:Putative tRNA-specific adenosine deaminase n=1 Tax=Aspergillus homomorphus (strain CBS 101889) TaxID=1450537 RepID=A0A395HUK4_ASPHC|nr:putative tRNA-specific adenosine deaminase [Aspergillus homomorphus CBS 101889]RAL09894.1 putative tRNA-specific adenosine deaminase [Aspergillus homomorphus CBS 101889]